MERLYIVTLWRHEDLHDLYQEMEERGIRCDKKREMSRCTYYWMTEEQVDDIKSDSRVRDIELHPTELGIIYTPLGNVPHTLTNQDFYRDNEALPSDAQNYRDWGKLFCAGTETQRGAGVWGYNNVGNQVRNETVTIFSDGRDVDVVVVDDGASYDCDEWLSPSTGQTRYVQYDWYGELGQYVSGLPSITYIGKYKSNANNSNYHATHVMSTIGGQHYGWAPEANLYNLDYLNEQNNGLSSGEAYDLLRAFHKYKPVNANTGRRNPTVTNHSYGASYGTQYQKYPNNLSSVVHKGVTYKASNPGPSGWNAAGLLKDFGITVEPSRSPYYSTATESDIEDCIADGVVMIGAAGNDNWHMVKKGEDEYDDYHNFSYRDYDNSVLQGYDSSFGFHVRRGSSPTAAGMIIVGSLDVDRRNRRSEFSNFGTGIDVWAPGSYIIGAFNSSGTADGKYGGNNYYRAISGTSMASPQVCGVAACLASGKERFTQEDMYDYIEQYSHNIGSDGEPEIKFDGTHNSGVGEYVRNYSGVPEPSMKLFRISLLPDLSSSVGAATSVRIGSYINSFPTGAGTTGGWTLGFYGAADRWYGPTTKETYMTEFNRDFNIFEGDKIEMWYPRKRCILDVGSSNTSDGWVFKESTGEPHSPIALCGTASNCTYNTKNRTIDIGDRTHRNYSTSTGVTGNPTLYLVQGDTLIIRGITSTHPFYIKSALGSGTTNALTRDDQFHLYNNGGQDTIEFISMSEPQINFYYSLLGSSSSFGGELVWHTHFATAGTYYYQCSNHSSMNGEIKVLTPAEAYADHKFYFKTAQSQDSTSDLLAGSSSGDVQNQGAIETTYDFNGPSWQTRSGDAGTYYYQCGSNGAGGTITVQPYPAAGTYHDLSCGKGTTTKFLSCINPRTSKTGNISFVNKGRRNNPDVKMKYPRKTNTVRAN